MTVGKIVPGRPLMVRLSSSKASITKHLKILEIKEGQLTREVLRKQYISMVKKYHPDTATEEDGSLEKFIQVDEVMLIIHCNKIFPARRLEIKSLLVGVSKLLFFWCVDSCFCSECIESKRKKGRRKISGSVKMATLAWQLNVGFNKLAAKTRHQN